MANYQCRCGTLKTFEVNLSMSNDEIAKVVEKISPKSIHKCKCGVKFRFDSKGIGYEITD